MYSALQQVYTTYYNNNLHEQINNKQAIIL